jgi:hypothetical protein
LPGKLVQPGCFDRGRSIAGKIVPPVRIGHKEYNIHSLTLFDLSFQLKYVFCRE